MILAPGRQGTGERTESEVLAREDGLKGWREREQTPQSNTASGLAAEASPQSSLALSFKILPSQVLALRSSEQLCQRPPHTTSPQNPHHWPGVRLCCSDW